VLMTSFLTEKARRSLHRDQRLGRVQHPHADSPWLRELLPLLSQRLCAHLHNEDAQPLPAAYRDMELISVDAWNRTMLLICEGLRPRDALRQAGIGESVFAA